MRHSPQRQWTIQYWGQLDWTGHKTTKETEEVTLCRVPDIPASNEDRHWAYGELKVRSLGLDVGTGLS